MEAVGQILRASGKSGDALRQSFSDLKPKLAPDFDTRLADVEALDAEFARLRA